MKSSRQSVEVFIDLSHLIVTHVTFPWFKFLVDSYDLVTYLRWVAAVCGLTWVEFPQGAETLCSHLVIWLCTPTFIFLHSL